MANLRWLCQTKSISKQVRETTSQNNVQFISFFFMSSFVSTTMTISWIKIIATMRREKMMQTIWISGWMTKRQSTTRWIVKGRISVPRSQRAGKDTLKVMSDVETEEFFCELMEDSSHLELEGAAKQLHDLVKYNLSYFLIKLYYFTQMISTTNSRRDHHSWFDWKMWMVAIVIMVMPSTKILKCHCFCEKVLVRTHIPMYV